VLAGWTAVLTGCDTNSTMCVQNALLLLCMGQAKETDHCWSYLTLMYLISSLEVMASPKCLGSHLTPVNISPAYLTQFSRLDLPDVASLIEPHLIHAAYLIQPPWPSLPNKVYLIQSP
jgi:hypothetical protein